MARKTCNGDADEAEKKAVPKKPKGRPKKLPEPPEASLKIEESVPENPENSHDPPENPPVEMDVDPVPQEVENHLEHTPEPPPQPDESPRKISPKPQEFSLFGENFHLEKKGRKKAKSDVTENEISERIEKSLR